MKPELQRIAIAEACGWTRTLNHSYEGASFTTWEKGKRHSVFDGLPDYLNDLNACHEMEKVLTDEQYDSYEGMVYDLVGATLPFALLEFNGETSNIMAPKGYIRALSATASQRAEAFLRTIGKWEPTHLNRRKDDEAE